MKEASEAPGGAENTQAGSAGKSPAAGSLKVRKRPADRTPLVRLSWPAQPALGTLDFDDAEVA